MHKWFHCPQPGCQVPILNPDAGGSTSSAGYAKGKRKPDNSRTRAEKEAANEHGKYTQKHVGAFASGRLPFLTALGRSS